MHRTATFKYASKGGVDAFSVPLAGAKMSMIVVLPKVGELEKLDASLAAGGFDAIVASLTSTRFTLGMPKVKYESGLIPLSDALASIGMPNAFGGSADFTGISPERFGIGDVVQKSMFAIDEKGLEAAAATAIQVQASAESGTPIPVAVDRPYFIAVYDEPTKTVLFAGHVTEPLAN